MSDSIISTTDADFEKDVLQSDVPVVLDLWAPWCGPCRVIGPILEEISGTLNGKAKIVKLNVDENSQTAAKFNVMNIPTLIYFKNGQEVDRSVGASSKDELEKRIQQVIAS